MKVVLQRVSSALVRVDGEIIGAIGAGLLVLVGVREDDDEATALKLASKTVEMRVFPDEEGRFNRALLDLVGPTNRGRAAALVVSQFTLYADLRRGRRPSFNSAARPELAEPLVDAYARALERHGVQVARGRFGAYMLVESVNDGPVTIILDSDDLDRPRRA